MNSQVSHATKDQAAEAMEEGHALRSFLSLSIVGYLIYSFVGDVMSHPSLLLLASPVLVMLFEALWLFKFKGSVRDCSLVRLFKFNWSRESDLQFWLIYAGGLLSPAFFMFPAVVARWCAMHFGGIFELFNSIPASSVTGISAALIFSSLWEYWFHRLQHAIPEFWEFHKVHHTSSEMTVLTVYRDHPILNLISDFVRVFAFSVLGLHELSIVSIIAFRNFQQILIHSKIDFHWKYLGFFLISPRAHLIHHSDDAKHANLNFATNFAFWDVLFGTYLEPTTEVVVMGATDGAGLDKRNLLAKIFGPFWYALRLFVTRIFGRRKKSESDERFRMAS